LGPMKGEAKKKRETQKDLEKLALPREDHEWGFGKSLPLEVNFTKTRIGSHPRTLTKGTYVRPHS